MWQLLFRALKRCRLNQITYRTCKALLYAIRNKQPVAPYSAESVRQAHCILADFHADVHSSALTHNRLSPQVDLQIIVPVYQVEAYIEACVDSVLRQQTRYTYRVTLVNDGSKDRSRDLLRRYESHPAVEIIDQENRGFSGARNRALENITGRYVTFLDSDDRFPEGAIEALMQAAEQYEADVVQGSYRTLNAAGKVGTEYILPQSGNAYEDKTLLGYTWGKLFRAELFARVHFPEHYWFEDSICSYLLFPQAKTCVSISRMVYEYRIHPAGITRRSRGKNKTLDTLYITESLLQDACQMGYTRNDTFYEQQFLEFRTNQSRLQSLHNPAVDQAAFRIHAHLLEHYFPKKKVRTTDYVVQEMQEALLQHRYTQYKLIGYLL